MINALQSEREYIEYLVVCRGKKATTVIEAVSKFRSGGLEATPDAPGELYEKCKTLFVGVGTKKA